MDYITTNMFCKKMGDSNTSDIETIPSQWTPNIRQRSVYAQTDCTISNVKSDEGDNEVTNNENCDIESNDENKCDDFHVSGEKNNENNDVCDNTNKNDIVKEDGASEISMDGTYEDNVIKENRKLSNTEENVSKVVYKKLKLIRMGFCYLFFL